MAKFLYASEPTPSSGKGEAEKILHSAVALFFSSRRPGALYFR